MRLLVTVLFLAVAFITGFTCSKHTPSAPTTTVEVSTTTEVVPEPTTTTLAQ